MRKWTTLLFPTWPSHPWTWPRCVARQHADPVTPARPVRAAVPVDRLHAPVCLAGPALCRRQTMRAVLLRNLQRLGLVRCRMGCPVGTAQVPVRIVPSVRARISGPNAKRQVHHAAGIWPARRCLAIDKWWERYRFADCSGVATSPTSLSGNPCPTASCSVLASLWLSADSRVSVLRSLGISASTTCLSPDSSGFDPT